MIKKKESFDGMSVAKKLYEAHLTPANTPFSCSIKVRGFTPEYYRSDLVEV